MSPGLDGGPSLGVAGIDSESFAHKDLRSSRKIDSEASHGVRGIREPLVERRKESTVEDTTVDYVDAVTIPEGLGKTQGNCCADSSEGLICSEDLDEEKTTACLTEGVGHDGLVEPYMGRRNSESAFGDAVPRLVAGGIGNSQNADPAAVPHGLSVGEDSVKDRSTGQRMFQGGHPASATADNVKPNPPAQPRLDHWKAYDIIADADPVSSWEVLQKVRVRNVITVMATGIRKLESTSGVTFVKVR